MAFSFRPLDATTIEMELYAAIDNDAAFYMAVGFSDDNKMVSSFCFVLNLSKSVTTVHVISDVAVNGGNIDCRVTNP